jgi:CBS domain-containing protein
VCAFVVKLWDENPEASSVKFDSLFESALKDRTASDVMNYSKMNDCHFLSERATFKDVLKTLSLPGVHRVPMTEKGGILSQSKSKRKLARFITQTDVIRFVSSHLDDFGTALDVSILGNLGTYPAQCVPDSTKTIDAFRDMASKKITALGVLDAEGKLSGNISIRDIGFVVTSHPGTELATTVKEFLEELRSRGDTLKAPVTCGNNDTVRSVITKINSNRVHRVYILDGANLPCGVVSLSDICRFLLSIPAEKFPKGHGEHHKEKPKKQDLHHLTSLVNEALASDESEEKKDTEGEKKECEEKGEQKEEAK